MNIEGHPLITERKDYFNYFASVCGDRRYMMKLLHSTKFFWERSLIFSEFGPLQFLGHIGIGVTWNTNFEYEVPSYEATYSRFRAHNPMILTYPFTFSGYEPN